MPAPRVLFVKLSSLGDVVHQLPALTDFGRAHPGAHVAWAVEEAYADVLRLHPALLEAIPVALRALRQRPFRGASWRALAQARRALAGRRWDYVVDTQGLLKSALVAWAAHGARFVFDRASAREKLAARFYDVALRIPRGLHAVERNRRLVAEVFGYALDGPADYGLVAPSAPPAWAPRDAYIVAFHAASRPRKHWPFEHWVTLGRRLAAAGYTLVFPGGTGRERAVAARLAAAVPGAMAAPAASLGEIAALVAHAWAVVGVDTGLTHLAVALGRPTVGLYGATDPALTGLHGAREAINLGARGQSPSVDAVARALGCGEA